MLNRKELSLLKSGQINFIPLPCGYMLATNESKQFFIYKGGKKRYFLEYRFLRHLFSDKNVDQTLTIVKTICKLQNIIKGLKKDSKTRLELENLVKSISEGFEK